MVYYVHCIVMKTKTASIKWHSINIVSRENLREAFGKTKCTCDCGFCDRNVYLRALDM